MKSRRKARELGFAISNKAWRDAKGPSLVKKVGRPPKVDDPGVVEQVRKAVLENAQETTDDIQVRSAATGEYERVPKFVRTSSWLHMYTWNAALLLLDSLSTFMKIVVKFLPFLRKGRRKTDYCDHCALYHQKVLVAFWEDVKKSRTALESVLPTFFIAFDEKEVRKEL